MINWNLDMSNTDIENIIYNDNDLYGPTNVVMVLMGMFSCKNPLPPQLRFW